MTVPGRVDAAALLLSLDPKPWALRHARAVAEVAGWLALRIEANGIAVDRRLVEAAALLHDVDKVLPAGDPARALPHGDGSADWLTRKGHAELARAVANHPVTRLADAERFRRWSAFANREERIVAYADKRAGQHLESMEDRFASWRRRYPLTPGSGGPDAHGPVAHGTVAHGPVAHGAKAAWSEATIRSVWAAAERLEADVCRAANVTPAGVRRLAWTGTALASARARTSGVRP